MCGVSGRVRIRGGVRGRVKMTFTLLKKVLGENSKIVDGKCKALVQFVKLGWANIVTSEYILENDSTQGRY